MNVALLQKAIDYLKRDEVELGARSYLQPDQKNPCCAIGHLAFCAGYDFKRSCGMFARDEYGLSHEQTGDIIALNDGNSLGVRKRKVIDYLEDLVQSATAH